MHISLSSSNLHSWEGEILVIGIFEGQSKNLNFLDKSIESNLSNALNKKKFTGKDGEIECFNFIELKYEKLILIGLGDTKEASINNLKRNIYSAVKLTRKLTGKIGIYVPWENYDEDEAIEAIGESARLSLYKDNRFKSTSDEVDDNNLKSVQIICCSEKSKVCINNIEAICSGIELARELVAAPPNYLTPNEYANIAKQLAKENNLKLKVLDKKDCQNLGMGAYLAVAQGSDLDAKFIHLTYKPSESVKRTIALVGKGLTFDSGGYNLKVGASQIEMMKFDMGGSAAVIGAAKAISQIRPKNVEVHFIIAACENMINGSAVHPGDIVTASNGKTIEINNTDAEGRLTLADALVYASKLEPDAIVDLATLTGACVIALGDEIAGLWTNNDLLAEELKTAANSVDEGLWRMPLHDPYKDGIKSMFADMKNTGPRGGGAITAAIFLKEFISDSIPWAHIDIAGTVWSDKDKNSTPSGATGYGVKTLVKWVCTNSNNTKQL
tara:strand:- start:2238 stop:3731 length:1494 start_codon:yes stop_codon:yes gene_type:complete